MRDPLSSKMYDLVVSARYALAIGLGILSYANGPAIADAQRGSARYLYLQNCGATAIENIFIQVRKPGTKEWVNSGRQWESRPLNRNQAACFDTAGMYGDVPDGERVRLMLRYEDEREVNCAMTQVDKSDDGDLLVFNVSAESSRDQSCQKSVFLDWQPRNRCSGNGERFEEVQC